MYTIYLNPTERRLLQRKKEDTNNMKSVQKRLEEGEDMSIDEWMKATIKEMDIAAEAYAKTEERPSYTAIQRYKWAMFRNAVRYFDAMRARAKKQ